MSLRHPREVLAEHGVSVKKSFGQNFLVDPHHRSAIARQVADFKTPFVFEIGSGLGALTSELLAQHLTVHGIERDRDMARILRQEFALDLQEKSFVLHEDNAMTFDYEKVAGEQRFVVCGNLPYHLTSTLIFRTLEMDERLVGAVFMIQKEVAERIVAPAGGREYGILSVLVQALFEVGTALEVPAGAFWPRPQVDSAVIRLRPRLPRPIAQSEFAELKTIVKAAFATRRKTLRNCLKGIMDIDAIAETIGISADARPEALSPTQFIALMRAAHARRS